MNSLEKNQKPEIIVAVCVKDEAWMLSYFLEACSVFADAILVYDESTGVDSCREIYKKFPKVQLYINDGPPIRYDIKRKFIFNKARHFSNNKKLILPLDSDEILSSNILTSSEWNKVLSLPEGSLIHLQWVNLWKNENQYRVDHVENFGIYNRSLWMDDGVSEIPDVGYHGQHMVYTPLTFVKEIYLKEIVCLHYQFCNWERVEAKHRYYRAHEKVNIGKLSDLAIWRIYSEFSTKKVATKSTPPFWLEGWKKMGIIFNPPAEVTASYHDQYVLERIREKGADFFAYQDIWSKTWDNGALKPRWSLMRFLFYKYVNATQNVKFILWLERKVFRSGFYYNPKPLWSAIRDKFA